MMARERTTTGMRTAASSPRIRPGPTTAAKRGGAAALHRHRLPAPRSAGGGGEGPERNWFEETRNASTQKRAPPKKEFIDRPDLYTDNWDGETYKGSRWNILTVILALTFAVPLIGLIFAWFSYGRYWG